MIATTLEEMKQLGFTGVEAEIYVYLLQHPLSTGYEISKGTGLPRANTYQALETLVAKERITAVSQDPIRYAAESPARLLRRIQEETRQRCQSLERQLSALEEPDGVGHFWELNERGRIEARMIELINSAQRRIAASLWAEDLERLSKPLREARDRGCTIIINLFGEADAEFATIYRNEEPEKIVGRHVIALTIDFAEALAASVDMPVTGVVTENHTLVYLVERLIRHEAYLASIYDKFSAELEEAFGPHLVRLRSLLLPAEDARRLIAITAPGSEAVRLPDELA